MSYPWQNELDDLTNNPFVFDDPILGFEEGTVDPSIELMRLRGTGEVPQRAIRQSEIVSALPNSLDQAAQTRLALEMFLNVSTAYSDAREVFDEDGTVNQETFASAILSTLNLAAQAGPTGLNTTTKYLDILTNADETTTSAELMQQFYEKGKQFPFGLSTPVINELIDTGFSNVLGRGANKQEQKAFTEMILKLDDSISQTDIRVEAEQFARSNRPVEAEANSLINKASSVMRVLGMGV